MGIEAYEIRVARDRRDLDRLAAEWIARSIADRAKVKDRIAIALSGGETPRGVYRELGSDRFRAEIPWDRVHLFWGDERCVPPEDPESNYRVAYESLIRRVPIPPGNVWRMRGEEADPEKAAMEYEEKLRSFFKPSAGEWPAFDLALLGIGTDGHTASLFPGSPALSESRRWTAAPYVEQLKACRLTLTPPVFNHASLVVFLAAGPEKAGILRELLVSDHTQACPPFLLIKPLGGKPLFFLDREAARSLAGC